MLLLKQQSLSTDIVTMQKNIQLFSLLIMFLLSACGETDTSLSNWEHSLTGLYAAELSTDGRFAVVSSAAEGTRFWDIEKNAVLYQWRHGDGPESEITQVAISPDGSHVITVDTKNFVVWNTKNGKALGYWQVDADIMDADISNAGEFVLLGLKDGRAMHINQQSQRRLETIAHQYERVTSVAISADGKIAVTGGNDGRVMVWNSNSGKEIHAFEYKGRIATITLDEKFSLLFSSDEKGNAYIWNMKNGNKLSSLELKQRQNIISSARFSKNGKQLLTGFPGRKIALWDSNSGSLLNTWQAMKRDTGFRPSSSTIYSLAFTDNDQSFAAEASSGIGQSWKLTN